MLRELTEHVQNIYFTRRWRVVTTIRQEITELRTKLDLLEGNASPTAIQTHRVSLPSDP